MDGGLYLYLLLVSIFQPKNVFGYCCRACERSATNAGYSVWIHSIGFLMERKLIFWNLAMNSQFYILKEFVWLLLHYNLEKDITQMSVVFYKKRLKENQDPPS
jgi:Na+-driven multidrug efflux pump